MTFDAALLEQLQLAWAERLEEARVQFKVSRTPESKAEFLRVLRVFTRLANREVPVEAEAGYAA
jgi:hypothetical protein